MISLDLTGHRALVCGASQGIGRETALQMAQAGAQVIAVARNQNKLESLIESLPGEGHGYLAMDLSHSDKIPGLLKPELQKGPITILVCNAGGPKGGALADAEAEAFLGGFQTHVLANQSLVQALLPGMKSKEYGRVINIISTSVKIPIPNLGVSNTIRGAVASWAKTLANELGGFGITVNNVLPGFTNTERLTTLIAAAGKRLNKSEDEVIALWKNSVPVGRFANPEETAQAITFLASPMASYINGINLPVDGGRTGTL